MTTFDIHQELVRMQENDIQFQYEFNVKDYASREIERKLDQLVDKISEDPGYALNEEIFDVIKSFVKYFEDLNDDHRLKFTDMIFTGIEHLVNNIATELEDKSSSQNLNDLKELLSMYAFIMSWMNEVSENMWRKRKLNEDVLQKPKAKGKKSSSLGWDWGAQRERVLKMMVKFVSLDLKRLYASAAERGAVVGLLIKTVNMFLEEAEFVKSSSNKHFAFQVFGAAAIVYDQKLGIQTRIVQNMREDHLSEPMAELLKYIQTQYNDTELCETILRELKDIHLTDKDLKMSKSVSAFLLKCSQLLPKEMLKQMVYLQNQLDSESYTMRCTMIEIVGDLIQYLLSSEMNDSTMTHVQSFYDVMQTRFRDVSSYVRSKVLQVLIRLAEARKPSAGSRDVEDDDVREEAHEVSEEDATGVSYIPISVRMELVKLATGRLKDKASNVRKNAIKFLTRMIETAPFVGPQADQGKLSLTLFSARLEQLEQVIKEKETVILAQMESEDEEMEEDLTKTTRRKSILPEPEAKAMNPQELDETTLQNFRTLTKYYGDAIKFCTLVKNAASVVCELLGSNTKAEVVEAMNFFVAAHLKSMECAQMGVRRMVHKIWDKDSSDKEGANTKDYLCQCYAKLYIVDDDVHPKADKLTMQNLLKLVSMMNLAELTSLEALLMLMMKKEIISDGVIDLLWGVFMSKNKVEDSTQQKRCALQLLAMIGKSRPEIIENKLEILRQIGLRELAQEDLMLGKFVCLCIQEIVQVRKNTAQMDAPHTRLSMRHPLFENLGQLLLKSTNDLSWFLFAEQAVEVMYRLGEHPDVMCGQLLRVMAQGVLSLNANAADDTGMETDGGDKAETFKASAFDLARFLFFGGHLAIKQIVHLEQVENEWKRRKAIDESAMKASNAAKRTGDDLEGVTGNAEDEFTEAMAIIKEKEILFGQKSLLATFAPMVSFICAQNLMFDNSLVQTMAILTLCKLMCVSAEFCDAHLQLLFTILEKSNQPIVRSNVIIGLGDMTVSFNALIDQNISYLYKRLNDSDPVVKKNTLMVLTHLILNGMVKVKGQISEMAKCLEDADQRISDLAKLFFTELSTKDNAVYNNLPDIISNLSHSEQGVDEDKFKSIMRFLLEFIKKEKQSENIVEKLCFRFKNADTERQWRDVAFCLSLLSFGTEKSIRKVGEALPLYADKLHEPVVFKCFEDILAKLKKNAKSDAKVFVDEYEAKLMEAREKCLALAGQGDASQLKHLEQATQAMASISLKKHSATPRQAAHKKKKKIVVSSSEDEDAMDEDDELLSPIKSKPVASTRSRPARSTRLRY